MSVVYIPRQLKSIRSAFDYRSERIRHMAIAKEAEIIYRMMQADALAFKAGKVVDECKEKGKKIKFVITVYRNPVIRDTDNFLSSVNKLVIDPLVRAGWLPSDSDGVCETFATQEKCQRQCDAIELCFGVSTEATTGAGWKNSKG